MNCKVISSFILLCLYCCIVNAETDKVICYYASWATSRPGNGKVTPENIDPTLCTHINYAFLGLAANGSLDFLDYDNDIVQGNLKKVSDMKKVNPNLKCLFSVGGWSAGTAIFVDIASDLEKQANLAESSIAFFQEYNFDGIDIDWEYPYDKELYITLLKSLKSKFQPLGYLVTAAVSALPTEALSQNLGYGYDVPAMSETLDIINVMTYDFHGPWVGFAAQNSPLYATSIEIPWQQDNLNCNASITHWLQLGADPQKLAIGIAFYGRTYILTDPDNYVLGAPTSGPGAKGEFTQNEGTLGYNEICEFHANGEVVWDDEQKVPYKHDGEFWVGFDNPQSVKEKAQYAKDHNLGGVMIWSIDTDDYYEKCGENNGLLKAINEII